MNEVVKRRIEQIKRGEVPTGYKKNKLGVLPGDWTSMTVGECLEKVEKPVAVEPDKLYTQIGIRSHGKGLFYKEPVTGESLGNKSVFWVEPDCFVLNIVFAWEQAIGKTTENEIGMIGSHRFPMFRPIDNRVDVDYLIAYLLTKRGTDILEAASPGGAGRNRTLGQDRFMNSKIILPPINEQKKIAKILATQDKVIALKEKLLEEKKKQKKYLMQQLLTGKKRLPGFSGEWERRKLSEITFAAGRRNKANLPLEPFAVTNDRGFIAQRSAHDDFGYMNNVDRSAYMVVKPNSFAYNPARINVGSIGYYDGKDDVIVSSLYEIFQTVDEVDDRFLWHWFKSSELMKWIKRLQEGSVRFYFYYDKLEECNLMMPSLTEQQKISECIDAMDRSIEIRERELNEEKQKKKALMQLLLTGIVRV